MEASDKNKKKLWRPSWRGVIITLLVGSNIILIRIIEALVYKSQLMEQSYMNSTQTLADQLHDAEIRMMEIMKRLCWVTTGGPDGCVLCPDGWLRHNENCYYYSSDGGYRTWNESQEDCDRMGAHLLVIEDREQKEFIYRSSMVHEYERFWIGLHRDGDGWRWVDGQIYNTDLVHISRGSSGNCVMMHERGVYNQDKCESKHSWICQKRALKM